MNFLKAMKWESEYFKGCFKKIKYMVNFNNHFISQWEAPKYKNE